MTAIVANAGPGHAAAVRLPGPAGSLIIVDESHAAPVIEVIVAARSGSAGDPGGVEGLVNLAAETARRGAAGRTRAGMDDALDALGASLDVVVDPDSVRLVGHVLARNLDAFLALLADVVLRPDFRQDELARTRRDVIAQIDEMRSDDRALCARYFERRLYGEHPYGRAADGTARSLARVTRAQAVARYREAFSGANVVFAAAGDVAPNDFRARVARTFARLRPGPVAAPRPPRAPRAARSGRIQIVDKPDRQQTQIMFGHAGVPASHPDFLPLGVALAAFGGHGMKATLMDQIRTRRGLAYGAYMSLEPRRGAGPVRAWVSTAAERTVTTLELALRLYRELARDGLSAARMRFFRQFLAGSFASEMDAPDRRLAARVSAEIEGLPPDFVDDYPARVRAVTTEQVASAIRAHLRPDDLAITLVGTAARLGPMLAKSSVGRGAVDVVPYDSY